MPENMRERTRRPVRNKRYNRLEKTCAKNILTCFEITTNMQAINKECPLRIYTIYSVCDANGTAVILLFGVWNLARFHRRVYGEEKRPLKRLFTPEIKRFLKDWLIRRRDNPYPNRDEKKSLAVQTGLTYIQVWREKKVKQVPTTKTECCEKEKINLVLLNQSCLIL